MGSLWRVSLFGKVALHRADGAALRLRPQKAAGLLACLAYSLGHEVPREMLREVFWPDECPDTSRHNLRQALSCLRALMEPPGVPHGAVIVADHFSVGLRAESVSTDVAGFQAALRRAEAASLPCEARLALMEAMDLYHAPPLLGRYEDWAVAAQEELLDAFVRACHRVVPLLLEVGDAERALRHARHAAAMDPLREDVARLVIGLYARCGRTAEALRHYAAVEHRLGSIGIEPAPATRRLAESVRADSRSRVPHATLADSWPSEL
jgi:DNA-binding SARP family transcriptional activator